MTGSEGILGQPLAVAPELLQATGSRPRVLVVSHPCVVTVNQGVYARLQDFGWDVVLIVPDRWRHEYGERELQPEAMSGLEGRLLPIRIGLAGQPQRHLYLSSPAGILKRARPHVAFFEEESFSIPAFQWGRAAARRRVPFGVQAAENLDRALPLPARLARSSTLSKARFVAARSPAAVELVLRWGTHADVALVPHAVPEWRRLARPPGRTFTVGFAGRLVPEKGVWDVIEAARLLEGPVRVLFVGDGPMRPQLLGANLPNGEVRVWTGLSHGRMPEAYAEMDLLVLPSRSTADWTEQFGRVLVEALWCGTPVVGSSSGEIPWVIRTTGGGRLYPEGDVPALASVLTELRRSPGLRQALADEGRRRAQALFSLDASAKALACALGTAMRPAPSSRARGLEGDGVTRHR